MTSGKTVGGQATEAKPGENGHKRGPHPVNENAMRRLRNIEGQVRGIHRMVEEEKYCVDILTQISAVRAALNGVAMVVLKRHLDHCVADALQSGNELRAREIIDELMDVLTKQEV